MKPDKKKKKKSAYIGPPPPGRDIYDDSDAANARLRLVGLAELDNGK